MQWLWMVTLCFSCMYTERNGVWVLEDGDSCHKTGKMDR